MGFFANVKQGVRVALGKIKIYPLSAIADYNGARTTRWYGQKFDTGLSSAPILNIDHQEARYQVRKASHENLQMRAIIENEVDTVVAQGLNLSPEPQRLLLGLTPEQTQEWINDTKARFDLWAMSPRSNRNGRDNFYQAQRLMQKCKYRDGELFVSLSYDKDPSLLSPLRFQLLDPDQIREQGFTFTGGYSPDPMNKEGIVRNADGEEIAYKVWTTNSTGIPEIKTIPRIGRSGRVMMLHAMTGTDYAGQLRGISPLAVCVQDLEHILDFTLAHVNKAINQSNIAFTVESDSDDPAENPLKGLPGFGSVRKAYGNEEAVKQYGSDPNPDPNAQNVTEESLQPVYNEIPHGNFNRPGSMGVFSLLGKQKLRPFPDTSPSQSFNVFVDAYFSYITAATRKSKEAVLMMFNNNYSASRATLIMTWRIAVQSQWELDFYILGPIYEMWLAEEIAAGRKNCPGWADPRLRAAWVSHRYQGLPMPNIDPLKTMEANKIAVEMGATTLGDSAHEYNDSDYESNCIKNREAYKNHPTPPWGFSNSGVKPAEGDDGNGDGAKKEGET